MEYNNILLIRRLCSLPSEQSWVEFKHNKFDPDMIGQDISALANGATLADKDYAYMVWGIDDSTHEVVGTNLDLQVLKKGNEEIEAWLRRMLSSNAVFRFERTEIDGKTVGILTIQKAIRTPVTFQKVPYVRNGSQTKKLADISSLQEKLWTKLGQGRYEMLVAVADLSLERALHIIDYTKYFDAVGISIPSGNEEIVHYLIEDSLAIKQDNGLYSLTNLAMLLFARRLSDCPGLRHKAIRVVAYDSVNRLNIKKNTPPFDEGYALCLENVVKYIDAFLPGKEVIDTIRHTESMYPVPAIREALANACIHQELSISGSSILVEIFTDRIEITNPGVPLVSTDRIIDNPPRSRNEAISSLMRRMRMCEELGSGWDRIVMSCEYMQLPAPRITVYEESTKVTFFEKIKYSNMSEEDRLWSCYMHACIMYIQSSALTNASLRERFGLPLSSSGSMSRLIKLAQEKKLIKPLDNSTAPRYMRYIPFWA
ncbi:MAG: putative DNA binding domain-containing protein [Bacteroidales bacterium]|nr:putative DNA binding domain-containing protein [Bacteroidales bacterium]